MLVGIMQEATAQRPSWPTWRMHTGGERIRSTRGQPQAVPTSASESLVPWRVQGDRAGHMCSLGGKAPQSPCGPGRGGTATAHGEKPESLPALAI